VTLRLGAALRAGRRAGRRRRGDRGGGRAGRAGAHEAEVWRRKEENKTLASGRVLV